MCIVSGRSFDVKILGIEIYDMDLLDMKAGLG